MSTSALKSVAISALQSALASFLQAFLAHMAETAIDPAQKGLIDGHLSEMQMHLDAATEAMAAPVAYVDADPASPPPSMNFGDSVQGKAKPAGETGL